MYIMQEPEVSLRVAIFYIRKGYTHQDVSVSIDGAHIQTSGSIHFDIRDFLRENSCIKETEDQNMWQGAYRINGYAPRINVISKSGVGDVNILLPDGKILYIESKKIQRGKVNNEYSAMREAIGQLMTGCPTQENVVPVVAVPYSRKSWELASLWSQNERMKKAGIRFMLVHESGEITHIGF